MIDLPGANVTSAAVLRPGDVLVLAIAQHISLEEFTRLREQVLQRLPELANVVVITAAQMLIYRTKDTDHD